MDQNSGFHDAARLFVYQTISYCLRTSEEDKFILDFSYQNTIEPSFTFAALKGKYVTSQMLLSRSASIEMTEQHQILLNTNSHSLLESEYYFITVHLHGLDLDVTLPLIWK
jgi:hypothetical protein